MLVCSTSVFCFWSRLLSFYSFFFFNDTATTEIYTLSLHDALPISGKRVLLAVPAGQRICRGPASMGRLHDARCGPPATRRSEEHTSELQSLAYLVCRLLLEKKKKKTQSVAR